MDVVVVESPAKAKTINKYLGRNYKVLASFGHVRDLPAKDGSVKPDEDFSMSWSVDTASGKRLADIAKAVKDADGLILATDPDREGEAISWHVLEVLKQKRALKDKKVSRVVFNAITKNSVLDAMANPREIDAPLVDAYLARRALDYLVGFTLSPVLWRKLPGARSAGRVQSVALRLVCDRESEIERFVREEYWNIAAILGTPRKDTFEARLTAYEGKKLQKLDIKNKDQADGIKAMLEGASFRALRSRQSRPGATRRRPSPPPLCSKPPPRGSASRPTAPCRWRSGSTKAWTSAARRPASSPTCVPTACRWRRRRSRRPVPRSARNSATSTCRRNRATTPPRPRTRRKRTRRSARPISAARRPR